MIMVFVKGSSVALDPDAVFIGTSVPSAMADVDPDLDSCMATYGQPRRQDN